jgi:hypothetical protein
MTKYIKIENNNPIEYSIEQLLEDHPDAIIYNGTEMPDEKLLEKYDVFPLITTRKPEGDVVEEGIPTFINNEWNQTWVVRDFTEEEKIENENNTIRSNILPDILPPKHPFLSNKELFVDKNTQDDRYNICKSCDKFINLTKQCKECGCFMTLKTKLKFASCPIGKW